MSNPNPQHDPDNVRTDDHPQAPTSPSGQRVSVGDTVIYCGSFGAGPAKSVTVKALTLTEGKRQAYGKTVPSVSVEEIDAGLVCFDLSDGHWCYSDQIKEIIAPAGSERVRLTEKSHDEMLERMVQDILAMLRPPNRAEMFGPNTINDANEIFCEIERRLEELYAEEREEWDSGHIGGD